VVRIEAAAEKPEASLPRLIRMSVVDSNRTAENAASLVGLSFPASMSRIPPAIPGAGWANTRWESTGKSAETVASKAALKTAITRAAEYVYPKILNTSAITAV